MKRCNYCKQNILDKNYLTIDDSKYYHHTCVHDIIMEYEKWKEEFG